MELHIKVEGNDTPEERAIILPMFDHILKALLGNEKVQPWMTVVILANVLTACIMQMRREDRVHMLEYFDETLSIAWESNKELNVLLDESGTGRPH